MVCHKLFCCEILGSHVGEYYDCCPVRCDAMYCSRQIPMFQRTLLPPSSGHRQTTLFVNAAPVLGSLHLMAVGCVSDILQEHSAPSMGSKSVVRISV
jgi:hypothetical protein